MSQLKSDGTLATSAEKPWSVGQYANVVVRFDHLDKEGINNTC